MKKASNPQPTFRKPSPPPAPPKTGLSGYGRTTCSVFLDPAGWQAVIENLRRGAVQYELATGYKAGGTIALIRQIQDQLEPNSVICVNPGEDIAEIARKNAEVVQNQRGAV